jgi:hypothetical protein
MKKPRNTIALDAWNRHGGPHSGARRPERSEQSDIDAALDEMESEFLEALVNGDRWTIEVDGELLEVEFDWDSEDEDDEDDSELE